MRQAALPFWFCANYWWWHIPRRRPISGKSQKLRRARRKTKNLESVFLSSRQGICYALENFDKSLFAEPSFLILCWGHLLQCSRTSPFFLQSYCRHSENSHTSLAPNLYSFKLLSFTRSHQENPIEISSYRLTCMKHLAPDAFILKLISQLRLNIPATATIGMLRANYHSTDLNLYYVNCSRSILDGVFHREGFL